MTADELAIQFPDNILNWIKTEDLNAFILETLDSMDWNLPELQDFEKRHPEFRPKSALHLLTYSYLTGIFSAEDIVTQCKIPGIYQEIIQRMELSELALSRFRRENFGLITMCVFLALKWALFTHLKVNAPYCPSGIKKYIEDEARARLNLARNLDRALVEY